MYNTDAPKFPEHVDNEHSHASTIILPAFAGTQIRNGPYGAVSAPGSSDGETHAVSDKSLPLEDFKRAVDWVIKHDAQIRDALFVSFVDHYNEMREQVIECLVDEDPDDIVPEVRSPNELLRLCGLIALHVNSVLDNAIRDLGSNSAATGKPNMVLEQDFLG